MGRLTDISSLRMGCPPSLCNRARPSLPIGARDFAAHGRVHLQPKRQPVLCAHQRRYTPFSSALRSVDVTNVHRWCMTRQHHGEKKDRSEK